jgi:pyruvate formate lyase activating enzyme
VINIETVKGIVFDFKKYAIHDGPGIRTTVFLKGCPLSCWWCHNPEGRGCQPQSIKKTLKLDGKEFVKEEITGKEMSVEEVIKEIEKDITFYDESKGGVTFSGGEVFLQDYFLKSLLAECKKRDIHTCIDTTGYVRKEILESTFPLVDMFLYDIKLINNEEHIKYAGVPNDLILDNLKAICDAGIPVRVRFPLIPGITDTDENVRGVVNFVASLSRRDLEVDLLPYHRIGSDKYKRLGMECMMPDVQPPSEEEIAKIASLFAEKGIRTHVGG